MARVSLFFGQTETSIQSLVLDATLSENHTGSLQVTEHPVEEGANIIDHARKRPDIVTIEGVVSNTPINRSQFLRIVENEGVTFQTTALDDQISGQDGHAENAYETLRQIRDSAELISIVTSLATYDNMILQNLTVPRNARIGDSLRFTATFQEVILVQNKTTTVAVAKEPKARRKVSTGKKAPKTTPEETKNQSILFKIGDGTGLNNALGL